MRSLAWRALLLAVFSVSLVPGHALLLARQRTGQGSLELRAPAVERPVKIDLSGETILPNGRLITPLGSHVKVAPHPYGLALNLESSAGLQKNRSMKTPRMDTTISRHVPVTTSLEKLWNRSFSEMKPLE